MEDKSVVMASTIQGLCQVALCADTKLARPVKCRILHAIYCKMRYMSDAFCNDSHFATERTDPSTGSVIWHASCLKPYADCATDGLQIARMT